MDNRHSNIIILACFVVSAVSVFFVLSAHQKQQPVSNIPQKPSYVPPVAIADSPKSTTIQAPDGKDTLTMKEEKNKETVTYIFNTSKQTFTKTVPVGTIISIPFNTFSPDDKYFFLKETSSTNTTYFVPIGDQTFDIISLFAEKHPNYKVTDVTGWGGMTLIVVNTDKKEGGIGPSFWFDVTSKSFIQLNNRFN